MECAYTCICTHSLIFCCRIFSTYNITVCAAPGYSSFRSLTIKHQTFIQRNNWNKGCGRPEWMMCWNNRSSVVSMPKIHTVSAGTVGQVIAGKGCAALESCWSYSDHLILGHLCNFLVVAHWYLSHLSNIIMIVTCRLQMIKNTT